MSECPVPSILSSARFIGLFLALFTANVPATPLDGGQLYRDYCSVCHGDKGDGDTHVKQGMRPPPRDFTSAESARLLTRERMVGAVREGVPGTAMVGWHSQLNEEQIAAVVDHIRHRFMGVQQPAGDDDRGHDIYAANCAVCHGDTGEGALWGRTSLNPPPVDFTDAALRRRLSRDRMIASVTHGRPGTAMAAFASQLSDADIALVVDYIQTAFMGQTMASTPAYPDRSASAAGGAGVHVVGNEPAGNANSDVYPDGLSGDINNGAVLYANNCVACHGALGDGNGPRAYFIFPKPRNFIHPGMRGSFSRATLFRAIKNGVIGKEMPAWGKVLDDPAIADVAEYVLHRFVRAKRSVPRGGH